MNRNGRELTDSVRSHLIGALHIGDIQAGDRLPSIREVARRLNEDQRRVARAYRTLQSEGLVEVRGRSGVYAAAAPRVGTGLLEETAEWLAQVLLDGWTRRIPVAHVPELLRRYSTMRRVRVALVDSCEDAIEAFGHELEHDLGLEISPLRVEALPGPHVPLDRWPAALRDADLIVTTSFSAREARDVAQRLGRPLITVRVNPQLASAIIAQLERGTLTVICADPTFGERIRVQYEEHAPTPDRIRIVLVDDAEALASIDPTDHVLLTRAARKHRGDLRPRMLFQHSPTLSPESTRELLRFIVRVHGSAETPSEAEAEH